MSDLNKEEAIKCLNALGEAWRGDWNDFDGRTLRDQLGEIASVLNGHMSYEMFIEINGIIDEDNYFRWK